MPSLEPNRALARAKLETLAWQVTPADYRGGSGSRRSVLMNSTDGTTSVELSTLTDNQLRKYIGPRALEEAGDMQRNGRTRWSDEMVLESIENGDMMTAPAKERAYELADQGLIDMSGTWKLTAAGKRRLAYSPNARREAADEQAARELSLFIENDYDLVGHPASQGKSIEQNLLAKIRNSTFDLTKSEQLWMYLMETGAKKYAKEFARSSDWSTIFTKPTRELVAHEFATSFYEEHKPEIEKMDAPEEEIRSDAEIWRAISSDRGVSDAEYQRALELADQGLINKSGDWKLTAKGKRLLAR